ncbi:hypothetical protein [Candidatus Nitrosocosmicus hydrocola]|uniref:hypothetical protein n=1 Tax=Candidatus Nitrosocosmicus hydrocola TaxID=1826872 RepID=UPI000B00FC4E|nr:hypothetical protein [Candidatus Nitrosocosmicus hydrocola]
MNIYHSKSKQAITSAVITMSLILIITGGATFILAGPLSAFAQDNNSTNISESFMEKITASKPFFSESGMITDVKDLGDNKTEFTYAGNGTLNGNISVTTKGTFNTSLIAGTVEYGKGSGQATTTDGSLNLSYDILYVQNITQDSKLPFTGALIWKTNSTSQLDLNDEVFGIVKGESDEISHNYAYSAWGLR